MNIPPTGLNKGMRVRATLGKTVVEGVVKATYYRHGEISSVDLQIEGSSVRLTMWDYTKWEFEQLIDVPQKKFAVVSGHNAFGDKVTFCRLDPNKWARGDSPTNILAYDDDEIRRALATGRYTIVFEGVDYD